QIVWGYAASGRGGNEGRKEADHRARPFANGHVKSAEPTRGRIIEADRAGESTHQIPKAVDKPHPATDARRARKRPRGNSRAPPAGDGAGRESDGRSGDVVWQSNVPLFGKQAADGHGPEAWGNKVFAALRLPSGDTLLSTGNGHSVLEVTP